MSFGKFAVGLLAGVFGVVFSNAVLRIAHAAGWFPDQQLASLLLAAPTLLQVEAVSWGLVALLALALWLAADHLVYRRQYSKAFRELTTAMNERAAGLASHIAAQVRQLYQRCDLALFAPRFSAAGITWHRRKDGNWKALWRATPEALRLGYEPKAVGVWVGNHEELDEANKYWIETRASDFQTDLDQFVHRKKEPAD